MFLQELARETGALKGLRDRCPAAHTAAASGLRTLAARDRGPSQEGEPGGSVGRCAVEAAEEVGRHRAVPRTGDRNVGRWRLSGQGVRRDDGEGAGPDRVVVAPALPALWRATSSSSQRPRGRARARRSGIFRRGRLCAGRPGLLDRCGPQSSAGGHVTVRVNTGSLSFRDPARFDLLAHVTTETRGCRGILVCGGGRERHRRRVCAIRKTQEAIRIAHRIAQGGHAQRQADEAANPRVCALRHRVHDLPRSGLHRRRGSRYRTRWQVELVFKRFRWRSWGICRNTTTRAPRHGSMESSWWRCSWKSSFTTPPRFPPGGTAWRRSRPHSPWRDFRFMLNQLARAIEPQLPLDRVIAEWNQISRSLAEPPRRRMVQIAKRFAEPALMGGPPASSGRTRESPSRTTSIRLAGS